MVGRFRGRIRTNSSRLEHQRASHFTFALGIYLSFTCPHSCWPAGHAFRVFATGFSPFRSAQVLVGKHYPKLQRVLSTYDNVACARMSSFFVSQITCPSFPLFSMSVTILRPIIGGMSTRGGSLHSFQSCHAISGLNAPLPTELAHTFTPPAPCSTNVPSLRPTFCVAAHA